jgi:Kyakuja-Dileera-Zisupton transposase
VPSFGPSAEQLREAAKHGDATQRYLAAVAAAVELVRQHGPLQQPPSLAAGERPPLLGVCADGNHKAVRYASAGSARKSIAPRHSKFFDRAHRQAGPFAEQYKQLMQARKHGRPAPLTAAAAAAPSTGASGESVCSTQIVCARESARGGGLLDQKGVLGFACLHGIPIPATYMAMCTAEQFAYYTRGLMALAEGRTIKLVGCNSSCKLLPHLQRLFPAGTEDAQLWQGVKFVTGYMHGSSHVPSCQVQFHAALAKGFGRAICEDMEHIFSWLKPVTKNLKYAAYCSYIDGYDDVLYNIMQRKVTPDSDSSSYCAVGVFFGICSVCCTVHNMSSLHGLHVVTNCQQHAQCVCLQVCACSLLSQIVVPAAGGGVPQGAGGGTAGPYEARGRAETAHRHLPGPSSPAAAGPGQQQPPW